MKRIYLLSLLIFSFSLLINAQDQDSSKSKIIFSVNRQNPYILMDDTLVVKNGRIFLTDTGTHKAKIWSLKHDVLETEFVVKNDVHLNRQFIDLKKREDYRKRAGKDKIVACVIAVSIPILLTIDTKYEPYDLKPYEDAIEEISSNGGGSSAGAELQIAIENYQFVKDKNEEEKRKADLRKGIVTGIVVAELVGLSAYIIHRALRPKLEKENPLLTDFRIGPQLGFNHAGIGLGFKF